MTDSNLIILFLTGLTTGGLTCLAIQGGLLTSLLSQNQDGDKKGAFNKIAAFLTAKLIVHTILGAILGFIGSSITLTPQARGIFQIVISIYLLGVAASLLDLHPIFRYFILTPPKSFARLLKNESKAKTIFAPAILGGLTVLIPCATTQAVGVLAITAGNPFYSSLIMASFILGTMPLFILFGLLIHTGSASLNKYFPKIAAVFLVFMAIYTANGGLSLLGSVYTLQNFYNAATNQSIQGVSSTLNTNEQTATITVTDSGYYPQVINLKKGVKTILTIKSNNVRSCARAFTIPGLNIQKLLPSNGDTVIEFTPENPGPLVFSCSMGMYTGQFNISN